MNQPVGTTQGFEHGSCDLQQDQLFLGYPALVQVFAFAMTSQVYALKAVDKKRVLVRLSMFHCIVVDKSPHAVDMRVLRTKDHKLQDQLVAEATI